MGSTRPYYRRAKPEPQIESYFLRDFSVRWVCDRLADVLTNENRPFAIATRLLLHPAEIDGVGISGRALMRAFTTSASGSMRDLVYRMLGRSGIAPYVNLLNAHMEPYDVVDPIAEANRHFDKRAAAAVYASVSPRRPIRLYPSVQWDGAVPFAINADTGETSDAPNDTLFSTLDLLGMKYYFENVPTPFGGNAPTVFVPTIKCLAAMAYPDYFSHSEHLWDLVSAAVLAASPGWCGSNGPLDTSADTLTMEPGMYRESREGNYDLSQMHLLCIAYRYYDELSPEAQTRLIEVLLAAGRVRRMNEDDTLTSNRVPNDWSRAGYVSPVKPLPIIIDLHKDIGETENHILLIHTARYLTNQLLYQRDHSPDHDNRRNSSQDAPSCTDLMLTLLRNILRDDFSEYNAKSYQHETRTALLNLCSYAYDHEVRLAARMVLDYVSAHIAVSSNDLRRLVPFRRRNEEPNSSRTPDGFFMTNSLLERGGDPMAAHFAIQCGNTRAFQTPYPGRLLAWSAVGDGGSMIQEALSDYRIPPLIHDLFVQDSHRRFFQRLHRTPQDNTTLTGRNCDNLEIYASSPSYLITAGGAPATYAVNPYFGYFPEGDPEKQLGVAVPTSFMPTGQSITNKPPVDQGFTTEMLGNSVNKASELIQFSTFSQDFNDNPQLGTRNYGVAPDFVCGHKIYLPAWCLHRFSNVHHGKFNFVDEGSSEDGKSNRPGFYLALLRDGEFALMEAFDTWLHPELNFDDFISKVWSANIGLSRRGLRNGIEDQYTTQTGNIIHFKIYNDGSNCGATVSKIEYGSVAQFANDPPDPPDGISDLSSPGPFLSGAILKSPADGIFEITNPSEPFAGKKVTLDMRDQRYPKRISEDGVVEEAGRNQEVWVDFGWKETVTTILSPIFGPTQVKSEGDFFRPFPSIADAAAAVADGGVIKIMPGSMHERLTIGHSKRMRIVAPIGDVTVRAH